MTIAIAMLVIAAIATALLVIVLRRLPLAQQLSDVPNERSLHVAPTPRVGGLALMVVALPIAVCGSGDDVAVLLGCAALLALVSLRDDVRSLPIEIRLPVHLGAATVATIAIMGATGIELRSHWVEVLVASLAIAWMTNLYNFMDGADGIAGGMAIIGFGAYAVAAQAAGQPAIAWCAAVVAAASAGFLTQNFPPARVFMGDAGSIPLGFLAGALGVAGIAHEAWPAWFPLLVFSPFIVDATVTLARRAMRRQPVWRAHREHAYQRLVLAGWSRRRLALASYALMLATAGAALAGRNASAMVQCGIITAFPVMFAILLVAIERRCKKRN
jgi:UDP-N-acetylmuramyl pentapeptide phosphotransferase/UDP-N-acetylglucosamine-1-phosphate transferase